MIPIWLARRATWSRHLLGLHQPRRPLPRRLVPRHRPPHDGGARCHWKKNGQTRSITLQAFERAVLSYDPQNPADFQVERGNIGADAATTIGDNTQVDKDAAIQIPAPNATVTLPLHILARFHTPDTQIEAELLWGDGTILTNTLPVLREDGDAIVVDSMNWLIESEPPHPATQQARLTLRHLTGEVIAQQDVTVLRFDSPDTLQVQLYFLDDQVGVQHNTGHTTHAGSRSAALQELLWGIDPSSLAGFTTALPTPEEVLNRTLTTRHGGRASPCAA